MNGSFKLALIQMAVAPGMAQRNTEHAVDWIGRAAAAGSEIVLLPEALPFGWMDPSAKSQAGGIPSGDFCAQLCTAAKAHSVYVCAGVVEKAGERIFNSAVLIDRDGAVILHHRKLNELEIAHECYALGDRLGVAETPFGRVGLMICADAFASGQVISRTLGMMGAQVILSPCAWAVPPEHDNDKTPYGQLWLDNYGPVASTFGLWIAGCSNVGPIRSGPWTGHRCIGRSLVVGPDGQKRLQGAYGEQAEEMLFIDVRPESSKNREKGLTPARPIQ